MRTLFTSITIFFFSATAFGQSTLQGVVTDSLTHEKLIGINVQLEGTSLGAATNIEGAYRISAIPERTFDVKASCIGYETKRIRVDFSKNVPVQLNFQLKQTILEGEAVVITAQMRGQVAAINQQISSMTIVNVVSEEKIKELPDANAAEAIGRLPGVSLIRSGGEATQIVLRGLSSKFSNITVDGIKVPATDPNTRDVDLSTISQGSLSGVELYKTLTPDKDGDAIAGSVNLVTRKAPSERTVSFDLKGDYNRLMKSAKQYDFSGRYGERFFDDFLGVQLQGNLEKKIRSKEDITYTYYYDKINSTSTINGNYKMAPFTVDFTDEDRTRTGGQAIFDINTPDSGSVKLSGLFSGTGKKTMLHDRVYPGAPAGGGSMDYNYRYTESNISTVNTSLQGKNFLSGFDVNWSASYAHSKITNPYDFAMKFTETPGVNGNISSGHDHPELYIIPFAANDFTAAACSTSIFYKKENFDKERTAFIDVAKKYTVADEFSGEIKFGGKSKDRTRWLSNEELDDNNYLHSFSSLGVDTVKMLGTRFADYFLHRRGGKPTVADFIDPTYDSRDLLGLYRMTPLVSSDAIKTWYDLVQNSRVSGEQEFLASPLAALSDYYVSEGVSAGYLMNTFNFGQALTVIAGVRVEKETDSYRAWITDGGISTIGIRQYSPNGVRDTTTIHSETIWLPSIQLSFKPIEYLTIRSAAYKALARPDYNLRLATFYVNGANTFSMGNPELKNVQAWNYELNTQVYSNTIGLFTISGFYKVIDNLVHQLNSVTVDVVDSMYNVLGMNWQNTQPWKNSIHKPTPPIVVSFPYNSTHTSYAWGLEFEHQLNLGFLPGYLSHITLSYNVSITRSETYILGGKVDTTHSLVPHTRDSGFDTVDIYHHGFKDIKRESEGQPDLYGNAALGYDIGGFSARVSVFYQDKYIQSYSSDGQADGTVDPFAKLDIALKQKINETIAVILNINNVTNRQETRSFKDNISGWTIPRSAELYGTTVDLGVRVSL